MRALLLSILALAVAIGAFVWWQRDTDDDCVSSSTIYDGDVLPGGPQTAEEALDRFLALGLAPDEAPSDPSAYAREESSSGNTVTFVVGRVSIGADRRSNGWFIGSAAMSC